MKSIITISLLLMGSLLASAQSIFDISLKNVETDETVALSNYQNGKGVAIIFMSVKCPYAKYYESRLQKISQEYSSKGLVFLMVNANSTESFELMKKQGQNLGATYLSDKSKELSSLLGAKKSPEVFLLNSDGKVYYSGAIDDNPQVASDVRSHYLKEAIDGLLAGKPSANSTNRPVGCMIR